ncbi:MAG: hypothetical protein GY929_23440 [Actinomycetia bacterium]|nr:hypothetical protein [Actinomycetes bacterium]
MTSARPVDLDALARLEEERDFLLRSLDDLEAEYEAGDLEPDDYATLGDDYTARAAAVIRSIEERQLSLLDARPASSWTRTLAWVAAVVAGVTVTGVLLVQFTGERGEGDSITGEIRASPRQALFDCQEMAGQGEILLAIECLDLILETDAENVDAVTYRGWYLYLATRGSSNEALVDELTGLAWIQLDRAVAIEPSFSDARAFRAIVALDQGDAQTAGAELQAFDDSNPPVDMTQLVDGLGLRDRIAEALSEDTVEETVADSDS